MFTSIRSRLWLTYILMIVGVLCVVTFGLTVYLLKNPPATRQTFQRLQIVANFIQIREAGQLQGLPPERLKNALQRTGQAVSARIILLNPAGEVLGDSLAGAAAPPPAFAALPKNPSAAPNLEFTDAKGRRWLYTLRQLDDGSVLVVAAEPPVIPLRQVLREDILPPLTQTGLLALIVALLLGYWLARWISAPLRRISSAARALAAGEHQKIPIVGPAEVRSLAQSFNEMMERMNANQQSQRDFVANVSHELKTPLTSIQGFAQAIMDGAANSPEQVQQAASVIHTEAGRMNRLVLDLLDLARIDSGIAEFKREAVDLTRLLQSVVEKFTPQATQAQVELRAEIGALPALVGDMDRLVQVFTNLVDNAIKHTPAGGRAAMRARPVDGFVEISVSDTGPGIPADDLSRIFERFYQVDKSRRGGGGHGVGLGLAITREIVQAHAGSITAYSIPERGSTFTVKLPVARPDDSTLAHRKG